MKAKKTEKADFRLPSLPRLPSARRPARRSYTQGAYATVLELGTTCIRAAVCELRPGQAIVLGVGREPLGDRAPLTPTGAYAMPPELVASLCDVALRRAEDMTLQSSPSKIVPDNVVIGVPGDVICCFPTTVQVKRRRPDTRITEDELASLLKRIQRLAARQLQDHPRASLQYGRGGWVLTNAMVTEVQVDGQRVVDPLRFQGQILQVTVASVFAPGAFGQMAAALAADMDLQLMRLVAEPFALACSFPTGDAIFLDIGGDRTDVALVRRATVVAVDSLPLGSRTLTRQIARRLNLPFDRAEEVKLKRPSLQQGPVPLAPKTAAVRSRAVAAAVEAVAVAVAEAPHRTSSLRGPATPADPLTDCVNQFIAAWQDDLAGVLTIMASHESLPLSIYLAGGGSQLPEIAPALTASAWLHRLPFDSLPRVSALPPREVRNLADRSHRLLGPNDLPLMALARLAAVADHPETLQDRLLKKVIGDNTVPFRK